MYRLYRALQIEIANLDCRNMNQGAISYHTGVSISCRYDTYRAIPSVPTHGTLRYRAVPSISVLYRTDTYQAVITQSAIRHELVDQHLQERKKCYNEKDT
ncbi:hypothetical protein GW17_00014854 [Ensete ventricosum]|nr:hypothetical protein GW17_00014854 [Ensete ventricosum]